MGGKWREAFNMITNDAAHTHSREKETIVRFVSLCCVPQGRGHGSSSICKEQGGAPFHQAVDLCPVCVCVDQTSTSQTTERQLFFGLDRRFTTHTHDHTRDYTAYEREKKIQLPLDDSLLLLINYQFIVEISISHRYLLSVCIIGSSLYIR